MERNNRAVEKKGTEIKSTELLIEELNKLAELISNPISILNEITFILKRVYPSPSIRQEGCPGPTIWLMDYAQKKAEQDPFKTLEIIDHIKGCLSCRFFVAICQIELYKKRDWGAKELLYRIEKEKERLQERMKILKILGVELSGERIVQQNLTA